MFKNYIKIALRNLKRHEAFSFINIMGLAVGMTACFLIFLYVSFETSYDNFNTKAGRIYRVISDVRTPSGTINSFAVLAIFVSCRGLPGLSSYSTIQRTKEIGVREVLGANVSNIVRLLSLDFIKLVLIAFVIAIPLAWFGMNKWLEDFAYCINISWWVFVLAALASVSVAFFTISFQGIKATIANPVRSLRTK